MSSPSYMVVEDGGAATNSNAYWDVDSVVTYLVNKGVLDVNDYTQDAQARAIISSTMYIEKRFKRRYRGIRQTVEQALGWPRIGAFDDDNFCIFGIPYQLQFACAEYAIRAMRIGVLAPDPLTSVPAQDLSQPKNGLTPGTATFTATTNFSDADTVTIGQRTYTFQSALTQADGNVLIGASLAASLANLMHAINDAGGTAGTDYFVTQADQAVTANALLKAIVIECVLTTANSVAVATTSSAGAWNASMISGYSYKPKAPSLIIGPVRSVMQRVGSLEVEKTYDGLSALAVRDERTTRSAQSGIVNDYNIPEYPEADLWLEQILRNPSSGTTLVRGS